VSSLICNRWLTHKLATFMGSTDSLERRFSCHDRRSVVTCGCGAGPIQRTCEEGAEPSPCCTEAGLVANLWVGGWWGRRSTGRTHCMLHSTSAHFRPENNLGLKSFNYYPSPRPFTPQRGETCRPTLPRWMLAEGRHTHTQHTHLDSCSCQEHVHAWVCSALTYSFRQCPGIMLALSGVWQKGPN